MDQDAMFAKINEMTAVVKEVNRQFQNPDLTTLVWFCISGILVTFTKLNE